ncbi:MAG: DEAD/DEAH box helicase family protein, partial [Chitinophagales bacterium]|nr:DEAD/DEAH box helicase family protein [Chitinophagales bacterium]
MKEQSKLMKSVEIEDVFVRTKQLYPYQEAYIKNIYEALVENESRDNIVFQLPTGGGKTIIFSEIARRYIEHQEKKI